MVFTDWTLTLAGISSSGTLDTGTKYAGNSSYRAYVKYPGSSAILTHNTFSSTKAQVIFWTRTNDLDPFTHQGVTLAGYGSLDVNPTVQDTWEKWRVTFWYDASSNIKWARKEKWDGAAWIQSGSDTNMGTGSPSTGAVSLYASTGDSDTQYNWFDELEVYS